MPAFERSIVVPNLYQSMWEDDNSSSDEETSCVQWKPNAMMSRPHDNEDCSSGTLISMGAMLAASVAFGSDKQGQVAWQANYLCPATYSVGESATPLIPMEAALRAKMESRRQSDDTLDSFTYIMDEESDDDEKPQHLDLETKNPQPQPGSAMEQQQPSPPTTPGCMHLTMGDRLSMEAWRSIHDALWCGGEMDEE